MHQYINWHQGAIFFSLSCNPVISAIACKIYLMVLRYATACAGLKATNCTTFNVSCSLHSAVRGRCIIWLGRQQPLKRRAHVRLCTCARRFRLWVKQARVNLLNTVKTFSQQIAIFLLKRLSLQRQYISSFWGYFVRHLLCTGPFRKHDKLSLLNFINILWEYY